MERNQTQQTGSVILEALIAILIFSIGILALVGLQATAINNVADAKYRSTAGFLANQIIGTVMATSQSNISASGVQAITPDNGFCTPAPCLGGTANAQALTAAWVNSVASALPNTTGVNAPSIAVAGSAVTVTISWQPPKDTQSHRHAVSAFIN